MESQIVKVKQENPENYSSNNTSTSTSSNDFDINENNKRKRKPSTSSLGFLKKPKVENFNPGMSPEFLNLQVLQPQAVENNNYARTSFSTPDEVHSPLPLTVVFDNQEIYSSNNKAATVVRGCKQFWKAGDYEEVHAHDHTPYAGMDHVRVHPKFLHSNATSHKWALGAFAELLDNSLDEARNGANYVRVDVLRNQKDGSMMLLVEDNGGGMSPDKMRQCMSLGYSAKSKEADTIGEYGNGFKTSTMRLGADVVVFSRSQGEDKKCHTKSIGLLSYTFLIATGKEDIVVPMIDFEKRGESWNKKIRSSLSDWNANLDTILQWSPFVSEEDLNQQFIFLKDQGTRVIIYNLWEDEENNMELDFDADPHDIQIRGRNEQNIQMAEKYPHSKHFFTYKHSLRIYAAILYQKLPTGFRIFLRGKNVEHHDIRNDMMLTEDITYRPQSGNNPNLQVVAKGKIGFVKDARDHIDIQGFNIYHRNRLIKPFWRVWNAAGSDGRGVIGVLEANFVKPAHDKQGFERTDLLQRLELRLKEIQKNYWSKQCQEIGYAPRRNVKHHTSSRSKRSNASGQSSTSAANMLISPNQLSSTAGDQRAPQANAAANLNGQDSTSTAQPSLSSVQCLRLSTADIRCQQISRDSHSKKLVGINENILHALKENGSESKNSQPTKMMDTLINSLGHEGENLQKLANQLEEKTKELEAEKEKSKESDQYNLVLLKALQEEMDKCAQEKKVLTDKLEDALKEIDELKERVRQLEERKLKNCKTEQKY